MKRPWTVGKYTYATDGNMLIRITKMAGFPPSESAPKISGPLAKILDSNPPEWHCIPFVSPPKEIPCPWCKGTGEEDGDECDSCDGTGCKVDIEAVMIGNSHYGSGYLNLLAALPGIEISPNDPEGPAKFRFDGGCGIIMPMLVEK
jgi:hypothetical protein